LRTTKTTKNDAESSEQRAAESAILTALERELGMKLRDKPRVRAHLSPDGFGSTEHGDYVCVEVYSRQGSLKGGQPNKVLADACKMLLVESQLKRKCRKILAFACDDAAALFASGSDSWRSAFLEFNGVEVKTVAIPTRHRQAVVRAQVRQASAQARAPKG
jgi:hypothetical protein